MNREFAYSLVSHVKVQGRNLTFTSASELRKWLEENAPLHFYFGAVLEGGRPVYREPILECDTPDPEVLRIETVAVLEAVARLLGRVRVFVTNTGGRSFHIYILEPRLGYLGPRGRAALVERVVRLASQLRRAAPARPDEKRRTRRQMASKHLDRTTAVDVKHVTRFPFSIHGSRMNVCMPVTMSPVDPETAARLVAGFRGPVPVGRMLEGKS